jgi:hypothetical protein
MAIRSSFLLQQTRRTRHLGLSPWIMPHPTSGPVPFPGSTEVTHRSVMTLHFVNSSGRPVVHTVLPRARSCRTGHP